MRLSGQRVCLRIKITAAEVIQGRGHYCQEDFNALSYRNFLQQFHASISSTLSFTCTDGEKTINPKLDIGRIQKPVIKKEENTEKKYKNYCLTQITRNSFNISLTFTPFHGFLLRAF